jgi:hypothetical protein
MRGRIARWLLILLFAFALGRHIHTQTKVQSPRRPRPSLSRVAYPLELRERDEFCAEVESVHGAPSVLQPVPNPHPLAGWLLWSELGALSFVQHSDDICYLFMSLQR